MQYKRIEHNVTTGEIIELEVSQAEIDQIVAEEEARIAAIPYSQKRQSEYPAFTDYLDGIVKGDQAQIQAYIDACVAVKEKYPKPQ